MIRLHSILQYARVLWVSLFLVLATIVGYPNVSYAAVGHIIRDSATTVARDQEVEDVVLIGNDADISGTVTDAVIVINGNVHLRSTARTGLVIDIGGTFTKDPGAKVEEEFTLSFNNAFKNTIAAGGAITFLYWACRLAMSVGMVVFPVLIVLLLNKRLQTPATFAEQSARQAGFIGFLASIGLLFIAGVFGLTIVGLPVTAVILIGYGIASLLGMSSVSIWIGRLAGRMEADNSPLWKQSLMGAIVIMAFSNIPLIGPFIFAVSLFIGIGTVYLWIWKSIRNRRKQRKA
jgi:hypothetical protein